MKIRFKIKGVDEFMVSDSEVQIIDEENGTVIGRIFSADSIDNPDIRGGNESKNAIQICGFDFAYSLWGCGVINGEDGYWKKDIQLLFSPRKKSFTAQRGEKPAPMNERICLRCFNKKEDCTCEELKVFDSRDAIKKFIKKRDSKRLQKKIVEKL